MKPQRNGQEEEREAARCNVPWKCAIFIGGVLISACTCLSDTLLSAPLNVTIREIEVNSAVVTWEILEGDPVIGFAVTQQVPSAPAQVPGGHLKLLFFVCP